MELKQWLWILFMVIAFSVMVITVTGCANVTTSRSYVTTTHDVSSAFTSIKIKSVSANVKFMLADDGLCRVECFEHKNARHAVKVEDGALTIAQLF